MPTGGGLSSSRGLLDRRTGGGGSRFGERERRESLEVLMGDVLGMKEEEKGRRLPRRPLYTARFCLLHGHVRLGTGAGAPPGSCRNPHQKNLQGSTQLLCSDTAVPLCRICDRGITLLFTFRSGSLLRLVRDRQHVCIAFQAKRQG